MIRTIKILFYLIVFITCLVVAFAYLGDLSPQQDQVSEPVELDAN